MPGRIGPSPETPSPYLPDPDQRLPGFARAALLKKVKNCRGCNPGNPRKDRPKKDFFQLPCFGGPSGSARGAAMMEAISGIGGREAGPHSDGTLNPASVLPAQDA